MTKHLSSHIVKAVKKGDVIAVKLFLKVHKNNDKILNATEKYIVSTGLFKLGDSTGSQNDRLPHMAIRFGQLQILKELVACEGINLNLINRNSDTPLSVATQFRNVDAINILLTSPRLDVNIAAPYTGQTVLMTAAQMGNMEIVKLLLDHGANKDLRNANKYTAAEEAAAFGHKDISDFINAYQAQHTSAVIASETTPATQVRSMR